MYRCIAQIDKEALLHNIKYLQNLSNNAHCIVMVKANAYGHGLKEIALLLNGLPSISFGVATIEEAIILRKLYVSNAIYLFDGGAFGENLEALLENDVIPLVSEKRTALSLIDKKYNTPKKIHLKIDTGFTRLGFDYREVLDGRYDQLFQALSRTKGVFVSGIATHFCSADLNSSFTDIQIDNFTKVLRYLKAYFSFSTLHMANSSGILRKKFLIDEFNYADWLVRPGLAVYGINPLSSKEEGFLLRPVLSLKAQIIALKKVSEGQGVGYGHTFVADKKRTIAIIAMGYGDGLRRMLSRKGHVLLKGQKAPIVGTISMDSSAIDVTDIIVEKGPSSVLVGDLVTVLGKDENESISAQDLATLCETVPYEILTSVGSRLHREIV